MTVEERDDGMLEAESRIAAARSSGATELSLAGLGLRELPGDLSGLIGLESLVLRGNRFAALPAGLAGLTALTALDLADNQLIELPPWLAALPGLVHLDVSGNPHLIVPPPDVVAQGTESVLDFLRVPGGAGESRSRSAPVPSVESTNASPPPRVPAVAVRGGAVAAVVVLIGTAAAVVTAGADGGGGAGRQAAAAARVAGVTSSTSPASANVLAASPDPAASGPPPSPAPPDPTSAARPAAVSSAASAAAPATQPPASTDPEPPAATTTRPAAPRASGPRPSAPPPPQYPVAPPNVDLALGRPASADSVQMNYVPANAVDGDPGSYWESANGPSAFPQTFTVDLGTVTTVGRLELDLPPVADWNRRTQTITVLGAGDDGVYRTVVGSRGYLFDARAGDAAGVSFNPVHIRFLRLVFTANDGWPAAQLSELKAFS